MLIIKVYRCVLVLYLGINKMVFELGFLRMIFFMWIGLFYLSEMDFIDSVFVYYDVYGMELILIICE